MISTIIKSNATKLSPVILHLKNNTPNLNSLRTYAFKSDLKIKWVRPEKIPCIKPQKSGDLKPAEPLSGDTLTLDYENSKELASADEVVRKLFTVDFNARKHGFAVLKRNMQEKVKRHDYDSFTLETRIAGWTGTIRNMQQHMDQFPRDKKTKVQLKELIDKRKKYLKFLRTYDYKCFEWLLEKLDLVYKPPPSHFHWITRKESLKKLTDKYCEDLKKERLDKYKDLLKSQQEDFLKNKIETLEFIRKEQGECGVEITISEKEIEAVKKQYETLLNEKDNTITVVN